MTSLADVIPATSTQQAAGNATLASILAQLGETLAISAAALPLPNGAAQETGGNLAKVAAPYIAATSAALTATINDTAAHTLGPFTPQLAREIWLTLNATVAASGTAKLLRSTDGGASKVGLTAGGVTIGSFAFTAAAGAICNEIIGVETDAAATYYLTITLTAGTLAVRVAQ